MSRLSEDIMVVDKQRSAEDRTYGYGHPCRYIAGGCIAKIGPLFAAFLSESWSQHAGKANLGRFNCRYDN